MAEFGTKVTGVTSTPVDASPFIEKPVVDNSVSSLLGNARKALDAGLTIASQERTKEAEEAFGDDITAELDPLQGVIVSAIQPEGVVTFEREVERADQAVRSGGISTASRARLRVETSLRRNIARDPAFAQEYRAAAQRVLGDFSTTLALIEGQETRASQDPLTGLRKELGGLVKETGLTLTTPLSLQNGPELMETFAMTQSMKKMKIAQAAAEEQGAQNVVAQNSLFDITDFEYRSFIDAQVSQLNRALSEAELADISPDELALNVRTSMDSLRESISAQYLPWESNSYVNQDSVTSRKGVAMSQVDALEELFTGDLATVSVNQRILKDLEVGLGLGAMKAAPVLTALRAVLGEKGIESWVSDVLLTIAAPGEAINEVNRLLLNGFTKGDAVGGAVDYLRTLDGDKAYNTKPPEQNIREMSTHVRTYPENISDIEDMTPEQVAGAGNQLGFIGSGLQDTTAPSDAVRLGTDIYGDPFNTGFDALENQFPSRAGVIADVTISGLANGMVLLNSAIAQNRLAGGVNYSAGTGRFTVSKKPIPFQRKGVAPIGATRSQLERIATAGNNMLDTAVRLKTYDPGTNLMSDQEVRNYFASGLNINAVSEETQQKIADVLVETAQAELVTSPRGLAITRIAEVQARAEAETQAQRVRNAEILAGIAKKAENETETLQEE